MKFNSSGLIIVCLSTFLFSCTKDRTKECDIDPSYSTEIAPFLTHTVFPVINQTQRVEV